MHCKITSFAIQNQVSHFTFNSGSPEGRAAGAPTRRSFVQGTTISALAFLWSVRSESALIDENIQSDWQMIV
jgi:hypothetical protein